MRVLLATTSNAGHFGPMLPFGAACRRAGHKVLVAAPEPFAAAVERAGYPYWPCADIDPDERAAVHARFLAAEPENRNEIMVTLFADLAIRSIMPGMLSAIDEWRPGVILREFSELGCDIAAELRQVPQVQVLIGLDKFVDFTIPLAAPAVARFRESLGLEPDGTGDRLHQLPSLSLLPPSLEAPRSTVGPQVFRYRDPAAVGPGTALPSGGREWTLRSSTPRSAPWPQRCRSRWRRFARSSTPLAELPVRLLRGLGAPLGHRHVDDTGLLVGRGGDRGQQLGRPSDLIVARTPSRLSASSARVEWWGGHVRGQLVTDAGNS